MSTRKNVAKPSTTTKKMPSTTSTTPSKVRESSKDRKKKMELQSSEKSKLKTSVRPKISEKAVKPSESKSKPDAKSTMPKKRKPEVPETPSSSRVSTSQFFPSKNMYSNALKSKESAKKVTEPIVKKVTEPTVKKVSKTVESSKSSKTIEKSSKDKPSGRLVKPTHSNIVKSRVSDNKSSEYPSLEENKSIYTSPDSSTMSERPKTATLRKGSIVNTNIVGPDVPRVQIDAVKEKMRKIKSPSPKSETSEEDKYEDDFESYESDFEAYSSSSSTNLDNISVEDTSSSSSTTSLEEFKTRKTGSGQKRAQSTSSDEERKHDSGHFEMNDFKHRQILDNIKESIEKENTNLVLANNPASLSDEGFEEQKSLQFINFLHAKKKYERRKSVETRRKRGKEILSMIRLDSCNFTLFELAPVPYETFIKNYGRGNTIQVSCQTGDDDVDEEVQTEDIGYWTKWTQEPSAFTNFNQSIPNFWETYKSEFLGVGSDDMVSHKTDKTIINENSLNKFILSAGELMLRIQEESVTNVNSSLQKDKNSSPFSDGYYKFNTSEDIFVGSEVSFVYFSCDISNRLVTVHTKKRTSMVAIRNVFNCNEAEVILKPYGIVSCCFFGVRHSELVFMGIEDGTISVWDVRRRIFNKSSVEITVPLFCTDINSGHLTKIVALHHLDVSSEENTYKNQANELCSLDEDGEIILWTVIKKQLEENKAENNLEVVLVKNTNISLKILHPDLPDLQCTDFITSHQNTNYLFISTNYGFIIHHLVKGGRSSVRKFLPGSKSVAKCLGSCPFSSEYFLAGYENGNVNIYSRSSEKPLMTLSDKDNSIQYCPIDLIQWSKNKPVVFYTKDAKNRINIWDLNESDMFPIFSIPFEEEISCMKLSHVCEDVENGKSYLAIGTKAGSLYFHQLNEEHGQQNSQVYEKSVKTFLNYVNRL
ncbi:cytoplasmic dynein 2 intermediate chain 1 [Diabrotica virgifera virgifera]|uniref:WD repeat-containing protein 60 n=1 Tax=Diabrotica virgifera virgifera TaxID=50390 RepID=A0ABM5ID07_DIAVI|nr:cytoplasmic dynein 2 intermediate chain 1 [Diabrotica virgifera virgifera]